VKTNTTSSSNTNITAPFS